MKGTREVLTVSLTALLLCGCVSGKRKTLPGAAESGAKAGAAEASSDQEAPARGLRFAGSADLGEALFAYDRAELGPEAREVLKRNADWLKKNPKASIQVAGHCDERGTTEYNLALGQRRAAATRDYYRLLGIPAGRMATMSWGKERPACTDGGEGCMQRNRRAETLVASRP